MKAVLAAVLLTVCAAASAQSEAEEAVLQVVEEFFSALKEARGDEAAALYSETAMQQVELTFQSIRDGIRRSDESVLLRIQSAGYQATSQDIRNWNARQYLAETLKLPMMVGRYTPFSMTVDSISVQGRRALVQLTFENSIGTSIEQMAVLVMEDRSWLVESFMGMTSFP